MTLENRSPSELDELLEALCEDRMTSDEVIRLESLVLSSSAARWRYLTYMNLHGSLFWDAAGAGSPEPLSSQEIPIYKAADPLPHPARPGPSQRRMMPIIGAVSACLLLAVVGISWFSIPPNSARTADRGERSDEVATNANSDPIRRSTPRQYGPPIDLPSTEMNSPTIPLVVNQVESTQANPDPVNPPVRLISSREVVAQINEDIRSRWSALEFHPSVRADDSEWMRRVYLDLLGRVPTVNEAEAFLADKNAAKRESLIDQLLGDSHYVRNFATKWTNLLLGRKSNPLVNRDAFQKFLRLSFAANRPWNQIVSELISAEGNNAENGATNFLIAHLNNDATPATAVVSRLFLGRQVHCNQCHNNPFDETKQIAFWELNSFFLQTVSVPRQRRDPNTGRIIEVFTELGTRDAGGPTYFETQTGLMKVAYPQFGGHEVDPGPETNRRHELARLMTYGEQPRLAASFVNRMWEHFFGFGFTRDVDDMGPHEPASHPELLAILSEQFIRSGYDVKQLLRWICQSEPYQLTSRFSDSNQNDDPSIGELPAFSRMYVKSMTAEQTYDSFLTATKAHRVGVVDWAQAEQNRQQWLQQFIVEYNNDDNDETMAFDGSVGNALTLMNGPLIAKALDISAGSFLGEVVRQKSTETEKIRSLCLATLSRPPSRAEFSAMKKFVRDASLNRHGKESPVEAYQDLFWALLNSNEFASIH